MLIFLLVQVENMTCHSALRRRLEARPTSDSQQTMMHQRVEKSFHGLYNELPPQQSNYGRSAAIFVRGVIVCTFGRTASSSQ
jgi:hypothetical protein